MRKKLLIIGIDGFDAKQFSLFEDYMPNFRRLNNNLKTTSVFPPDSIPAWGSIYTGLNPAEHGAINFIDINNNLKINFKELYKYYKGNTFWDKVSENGKRVCILLPFSIYPPWPVDGVMVCRTLDVVKKDFPLKTYPEDIYDKFNLREFNVNLFHGFPSKRNLKNFIDSMKIRTETESRLGLLFLKNYDADLYFIYFSALDAIQHTFWSYCDEKHPDYQKHNCYESVIKDFYILFDKILGDYLNSIESETIVIVMSDHGHGPRPTNLVNINEILRVGGYLSPKKAKIYPFNQKDIIKRTIISNIIPIIGVGNIFLNILNKFPIWKKLFVSQSFIDFDYTVAYVSDISGIKAYPQGGIIINKKIFNFDYEDTRNKIIDEMKYIVDEKGKKLMKWISKREELYKGVYLDRYPDILFELEDGYGVGQSINCPIINKSCMSNFQPGSHSRDSPIFLLSDNIVCNQNMALTDIKPLILKILDLK